MSDIETIDDEERNERALYIMQACFDWAEDMGDCLFCEMSGKDHAPTCILICPLDEIGRDE